MVDWKIENFFVFTGYLILDSHGTFCMKTIDDKPEILCIINSKYCLIYGPPLIALRFVEFYYFSFREAGKENVGTSF